MIFQENLSTIYTSISSGTLTLIRGFDSHLLFQSIPVFAQDALVNRGNHYTRGSACRGPMVGCYAVALH